MNVLTKLFNPFELKLVQWNCFKMTQARLLEFKLFLAIRDCNTRSVLTFICSTL